MSYDISIGQGWHNYTSNMAAFFRDFGVYPPDWNGMKRSEVAKSIEAGLEKISQHEIADLASKYDAPNGWGSVETAVGFLRSVLVDANAVMPEVVEVSW